MKQRISWKTLLIENADLLERGETLVVDTENPHHYIGLRLAAKSFGYTAVLRTGKTYVTKSKQSEVGVIVSRLAKLSTPPKTNYIEFQNDGMAIDTIHNAFYKILVDRGLKKEYPDQDVAWVQIDRLPSAVWYLFENAELDLAQPTFYTLRELITWHYENNRLADLWKPWLSATVRFNAGQFELFKRLDEPIPVMSEDDASHALIARAIEKHKEENERRLDARQQEEANKGWNNEAE